MTCCFLTQKRFEDVAFGQGVLVSFRVIPAASLVAASSALRFRQTLVSLAAALVTAVELPVFAK